MSKVTSRREVRVPLVEQELLTLPEHLSSPPIFSFMCIFRRSLFVLLYFFFWSLCCLFFFDIRILIISLWYLQTLLVLINKHQTDDTTRRIEYRWNKEIVHEIIILCKHSIFYRYAENTSLIVCLEREIFSGVKKRDISSHGNCCVYSRTC
jgi:hypothetical protein